MNSRDALKGVVEPDDDTLPTPTFQSPGRDIGANFFYDSRNPLKDKMV
jgi:hypothetical protein